MSHKRSKCPKVLHLLRIRLNQAERQEIRHCRWRKEAKLAPKRQAHRVFLRLLQTTIRIELIPASFECNLPDGRIEVWVVLEKEGGGRERRTSTEGSVIRNETRRRKLTGTPSFVKSSNATMSVLIDIPTRRKKDGVVVAEEGRGRSPPFSL